MEISIDERKNVTACSALGGEGCVTAITYKIIMVT